MRKAKFFLIVLVVLFATLACSLFDSAGQEDLPADEDQVSLGERFTLEEGQTRKVADEPLRLRLEFVGRDFTEEGEEAFAEITIYQANDEKTVSIYVGDTWEIGEYAIYVPGVEPFGKRTSCELIVTKP